MIGTSPLAPNDPDKNWSKDCESNGLLSRGPQVRDLPGAPSVSGPVMPEGRGQVRGQVGPDPRGLAANRRLHGRSAA